MVVTTACPHAGPVDLTSLSNLLDVHVSHVKHHWSGIWVAHRNERWNKPPTDLIVSFFNGKPLTCNCHIGSLANATCDCLGSVGWGGVGWEKTSTGTSHGMAASTNFIPLATHVSLSSLPYPLGFPTLFTSRLYSFLYFLDFLTFVTSILFSNPY